MKKTDKQLTEKNTDFLILAAALFAMIISFFLSLNAAGVVIPTMKGVRIPETCFMKTVLGIRCPTCGLTRAFISISHADICGAMRFNAAGIVAYLYVVFQIPYRTIRLAKSGGRTVCILGKLQRWFTIFTGTALAIAWLCYLGFGLLKGEWL